MRPLRRRSSPARVPKIRRPSGFAFLRSIPSSVAQCSIQASAVPPAKILDEIAQVFLFLRHTIRNSVDVCRTHCRREHATQFTEEGDALVATAILDGNGLQGNMIELMSYQTVEGDCRQSPAKTITYLDRNTAAVSSCIRSNSTFQSE